jgi:hypothetical protein
LPVTLSEAKGLSRASHPQQDATGEMLRSAQHDRQTALGMTCRGAVSAPCSARQARGRGLRAHPVARLDGAVTRKALTPGDAHLCTAVKTFRVRGNPAHTQNGWQSDREKVKMAIIADQAWLIIAKPG